MHCWLIVGCGVTCCTYTRQRHERQCTRRSLLIKQASHWHDKGFAPCSGVARGRRQGWTSRVRSDKKSEYVIHCKCANCKKIHHNIIISSRATSNKWEKISRGGAGVQVETKLSRDPWIPPVSKILVTRLTPWNAIWRANERRTRQRLRSSSRHYLVVPRHRRSTLGSQAFSVAGPMAWNALPDDLRDRSLSADNFRKKLKTHLFRNALGHLAH